MNKHELHDAVMGIDAQYLAHSADFKAVSASFRRQRTRRIGAAASVMGCAAVALLAVSLPNRGANKTNLLTSAVEEAAFSDSAAAPDEMDIALEIVSQTNVTTQPGVTYPTATKPVSTNEIVWYAEYCDGMTAVSPAAMSPEHSKFISDCCFGCKYEIGTSDCESDYVFTMENGEKLCYHSSCGTFNDAVHERSYHVTESMRTKINEILDQYFLIYGTTE